MTLCDKGHESVYFENKICPTCKVLTEKDDIVEIFKARIKELKAGE